MKSNSTDRLPAIDRLEKRHFWMIAIGAPALFAVMFSLMFFGLGHGN